MPKPVPLPPPGFDDLSVDEKIDYLQSLWDRIAAMPETIPVPHWHHEIIDERLKDLKAVLEISFVCSLRRAAKSGLEVTVSPAEGGRGLHLRSGAVFGTNRPQFWS
jgi:hypothetical protein